MPNPYFHFKQFTIYHDKCAMKIGTDGVLLGAWTYVDTIKSALDVGTGTGIIAIMLAQRSSAVIDAVEIDEKACVQAVDNIAGCPWHHRVKLIHASFQEYAKTCNKTYDLIVTNPPYFNNLYRPAEKSRAIARHDDALPLHELVNYSAGILSETGIISVILPEISFPQYLGYLEKEKLHVQRILYLKPTPNKPVIRMLIEAGKAKVNRIEESMVIETGEGHNYTDQYKQLTRDFYLAF